MKSRFEHIDASATWQLEWCTTVCSMLIWLWYISVYVVLSWCAAYTCSNAYVRGGFFSGFRSTRRVKSSACWLGLQQAPSLV